MNQTLNAYRDILNKINQKKILIEELKSDTGLKAGIGSDIGFNSIHSNVENLAIRITEEERELNILKEEAEEIYSLILTNILKLKDDTQKALLILRYLRLETWGEISKKLNYSKDYIRTKLHREAKREYENIYTNIHK